MFLWHFEICRFQNVLPQEINKRSEKYLTREELTKLMEWKLTVSYPWNCYKKKRRVVQIWEIINLSPVLLQGIWNAEINACQFGSHSTLQPLSFSMVSFAPRLIEVYYFKLYIDTHANHKIELFLNRKLNFISSRVETELIFQLLWKNKWTNQRKKILSMRLLGYCMWDKEIYFI